MGEQYPSPVGRTISMGSPTSSYSRSSGMEPGSPLQDQIHTAMARTVGLPVAMAAKAVLNGRISERGVLLPVSPEIYEPILDELEEHGVTFREEEVEA